jgi:hypothetical protein
VVPIRFPSVLDMFLLALALVGAPCAAIAFGLAWLIWG